MSDERDRHDVIVIGGGISGMSLAHFAARRGRSVLVLERGDAAGGCLRTWRQPGGGFWLELGAHTCYNSYGALIGLLEDRGALGRLRPRVKAPFRVYTDGKVKTIFAELGLLELLRSAPRVFFTSKQGQTVRSYYGRLVGERNFDHLFGPLFAAVPSQRADNFPADMLFKRRARRKDVLRSFTLDGGLQTIVDLVGADRAVTVATGAEVTAIERQGDGFVVRRRDGAEHAAHHVALAAPPPVASTLLRALVPQAAAALARIAVTPIESTGVVVRKDALRLERVAGVIPLDGTFHSLVSRDVVPDPAYRGFTFHFRPGLPRDERLSIAAGVLGTEPARFEAVAGNEVVLPSPTLGHADLVAAIDAALPGTGLLITGNYFGGLAIEDCVLRSRAEAARLYTR